MPEKQRGTENRVLICLPPETKAALDSLAAAKGLSRSAMIAKLVERAAKRARPNAGD